MTGKKKRFSYAQEVAQVQARPGETELLAQPAVTAKPEKTAKSPRPVQAQPPELLEAQAVGDAAHALRNPAAYALPPQRKGKRAEKAALKRTDVPREQLNVRVRPELKRAAAGLAGLRGMTLGDVVEAALIEYLKAARNTEL